MYTSLHAAQLEKENRVLNSVLERSPYFYKKELTILSTDKKLSLMRLFLKCHVHRYIFRWFKGKRNRQRFRDFKDILNINYKEEFYFYKYSLEDLLQGNQ